MKRLAMSKKICNYKIEPDRNSRTKKYNIQNWKVFGLVYQQTGDNGRNSELKSTGTIQSEEI